MANYYGGKVTTGVGRAPEKALEEHLGQMFSVPIIFQKDPLSVMLSVDLKQMLNQKIKRRQQQQRLEKRKKHRSPWETAWSRGPFSSLQEVTCHQGTQGNQA